MRVPLTFSTADLSASCVSQWVARKSDTCSASIGIGWPATGTPVGTLTIEGSDTSTGATGVTIATPATTPTGGAAGTIIEIGPIAVAFVRVKYTRTSGGTGATFLNASQTAGTFASITWGP